jgi:hypothetical protein
MPLPGTSISVERKTEKPQDHLIDFILVVGHALICHLMFEIQSLYRRHVAEQGAPPDRQPSGSSTNQPFATAHELFFYIVAGK